jgi:hypothetical protein
MSGMKKIILAGLSTMLLAACSDNELVETQQDVEPAATSFTRYMTVSIASNEASSTRAESASAGENKGIEVEYGVSKLTDGTDDIMFYLFDKDGNPYTGTQDGASAVTYDSESTKIYADTQWKTEDPYQTRNYIVKLNLKDATTSAPAKIVAILNGKTCGLTVEKATPTLDDLRKTKITTIGDDKYYRPYSKDNAFLMSNSAYGDTENRTPIYAQAISEGNCQVTPQLAKQNPVNIYVERVVSKVQLKQDSEKPVLRTYPLTTESSYYTKKTPATEDATKFPKGYTKDDYAIAHTTDGDFITNAVLMSDGKYSEPLILKLNGWNIFNTLESTTLEKDMTSMPTWAWNNAAKFRSYWSITSEELDGDIVEDKLTWSEMKGKNATDICYPFENTLTTHTKTTDFNTSILFAGKIQTGKSTDAANAKDLTLFYWRNTYYTKDSLKSHWASLLGYIYTDAEGKTPVHADDIKFLIAEDGYHVYPYLKITDTQKFYHKVDGEIEPFKDQTELANEVEQLKWAQYWNGGNCYYFTTIKHPQYEKDDVAADGTATYSVTNDLDGIVRNHWYQMSINTIIGLGTPVPVSDNPSEDPEVIGPDPDPNPNPDPEIDPVRPGDDPDNYWYLDVKCVIQPWQQVTNNLDIISKDGQTK